MRMAEVEADFLMVNT
uniref:Uncharacterized protein n=1 Tax=Rhizophora mucronata TaxID=61149 RepID=A0A2P2NT82_RHIMU